MMTMMIIIVLILILILMLILILIFSDPFSLFSSVPWLQCMTVDRVCNSFNECRWCLYSFFQFSFIFSTIRILLPRNASLGVRKFSAVNNLNVNRASWTVTTAASGIVKCERFTAAKWPSCVQWVYDTAAAAAVALSQRVCNYRHLVWARSTCPWPNHQ